MGAAADPQTGHAGDARADLERLLTPCTVGTLTLRNRVFVPGHTTNYAQDNAPTDTHVAYHAARARGGLHHRRSRCAPARAT